MFISDFVIDEELKDVPGYDGKFKASKSGRIFNTETRKELIQYVRNGYVFVLMNGESKRLHRVIMDTFNPNPKPELYTEINHIDENKLNNSLDNLEWCTHDYNIKYGTRGERAGETNGVNIVCLDLDGNFIKEYPSIASTEKDGFIPGVVGMCVRGKAKTHKKCIWMKKSEYDNMKSKTNIKNVAKRSRGRKGGRKKQSIYQIGLNGVVEREWASIKEAINCGYSHNVQKCVNRSEQKTKYFTANNYIWLKVEDYNNMSFDEYIQYIQDSLNKEDKLCKRQIEIVKKDFENRRS